MLLLLNLNIVNNSLINSLNGLPIIFLFYAMFLYIWFSNVYLAYLTAIINYLWQSGLFQFNNYFNYITMGSLIKSFIA